jgi:hypothetical protein
MSKRLPDRYPLNQSPLYKLRGKGQFAAIVGLDWEAIEPLLGANEYRVWLNDKGREIQQPIGRMAAVHRRIGGLLARIELPDYLYSQRGRSYADNARRHLGDVPLLKTDIHRFYPSTTWMMVYQMFVVDFECAEDVANRLANICCYQKKHLPTGSPVSGRIAFFAARHMFDAIAEVAQREECQMTAYVDDVTVSGERATKTMLGEIRRIVHRHGLKTKNRKSRTYAASSPKAVTGAVIVGAELRLPNERHRKIEQARRDLSVAPASEKERIRRVLRGRLQEAKQILR